LTGLGAAGCVLAMKRDLHRPAALGVALPARLAAAALVAPAAQAAPAAVPCQHTTGDHYDCTFWPAGDGRSGGAPVQDSGGARAGFLHKGTNWVICQAVGARVASGAYSNVWWGWTLADNNKPGWINAVWAAGGDNDGPFGTVPNCNGAHGTPPGGAPVTPPPPGGTPPPPPPPPPPPTADPRQVAVEKAVTWAMSKVGTRQCGGEQPGWNQSFGFKCTVAWCGVFAGTALDQAGFAVDRGRIPSTEKIYADAQSGLNGMSTIPKETAQRGDLILFNYVGPPRKVSHVGLVTQAGGGGIGTVEGNTNDPSAVATHQYRLDNRRIVAIVRVSALKGQPAGFRQYKAPNVGLRRKLDRRIRKLKNPNIEVGPGQKVPKAARRLRR
jgi:hypothetical protein